MFILILNQKNNKTMVLIIIPSVCGCTTKLVWLTSPCKGAGSPDYNKATSRGGGELVGKEATGHGELVGKDICMHTYNNQSDRQRLS